MGLGVRRFSSWEMVNLGRNGTIPEALQPGITGRGGLCERLVPGPPQGSGSRATSLTIESALCLEAHIQNNCFWKRSWWSSLSGNLHILLCILLCNLLFYLEHELWCILKTFRQTRKWSLCVCTRRPVGVLLAPGPRGVLNGALAGLTAPSFCSGSCHSGSEGSSSRAQTTQVLTFSWDCCLPLRRPQDQGGRGSSVCFPYGDIVCPCLRAASLLLHIVPSLSPAGPSPGLPLPFSLAS